MNRCGSAVYGRGGPPVVEPGSQPGVVPRPVRPDSVTADKAYSSRANRAALRARKIVAVIPERNDQKANRANKKAAGGRPPNFDADRYRDRNNVERGFNRRKHWRGLATRYDKRIDSYQATLDLAETLDWLRATRDRTP